MKTNKSYIYLEAVSFYSFHGVAPQEREIGNTYTIDLRLSVNISTAMQTDDVNDTVNYAAVYQTMADEMAIPSNLLEHVCGRIVGKLFEKFALIEEIEIKLSKRNPPMGADMHAAGVEMHCHRY